MLSIPSHYPSLTPTQRRSVRLKYIDLQNGLCAHCGHHLEDVPPGKILSLKINKNLFPKGMFDHPIHLHHSHETGMTIGAVHALCNAVLWQYHGE